jgi:hypothetical protein
MSCRKYYGLLLVLWQARLAYTRNKTTENKLSSLILPRLSTGMTKIVNLDLTSPDGAISFPLAGDIYETVAPLLAEDKQEVGEGGSDPSIQAGLSMIRFLILGSG